MSRAIVKLGEASGETIAAASKFASLHQVAEELVLNALDAEANTIKIFFRFKPSFTVRVTDDGAGIESRVLDSFVGTSRITCRDARYGRSGSSLIALGHVATLKVLSVVRGSTNARIKVMERGTVLSSGDVAGCVGHPLYDSIMRNCGTSISCSNIFASQTVRLAAVHSRTDVDALVDTVVRLSVVHPTVSFKIENEEDGTDLLWLPGLPAACNTALGRFRQLYGDERADAIVHLDYDFAVPGADIVTAFSSPALACASHFDSVTSASAQGTVLQSVHVSGFAGLGHHSRDLQFTVVNGRVLRPSSAIGAAVEAAITKAGRTRRAKELGLRIADDGSVLSTRRAPRGGRGDHTAYSGRNAATEGHPVFVIDVTVTPAAAVDMLHEPGRSLVHFSNPHAVSQAITAALQRAFGLGEEVGGDVQDEEAPASASSGSLSTAGQAAPSGGHDMAALAGYSDAQEEQLRQAEGPVLQAVAYATESQWDNGLADSAAWSDESSGGMQEVPPPSYGHAPGTDWPWTHGAAAEIVGAGHSAAESFTENDVGCAYGGESWWQPIPQPPASLHTYASQYTAGGVAHDTAAQQVGYHWEQQDASSQSAGHGGYASSLAHGATGHGACHECALGSEAHPTAAYAASSGTNALDATAQHWLPHAAAEKAPVGEPEPRFQSMAQAAVARSSSIGAIDSELFPPTPPLRAPAKTQSRVYAAGGDFQASVSAGRASAPPAAGQWSRPQSGASKLLAAPASARGGYTGRAIPPSSLGAGERPASGASFAAGSQHTRATWGPAAGAQLSAAARQAALTVRSDSAALPVFPQPLGISPFFSTSAGSASPQLTGGPSAGRISLLSTSDQPAHASYAAFRNKGMAFADVSLAKAGAAALSARSAWAKQGPMRGRQNQAYVAHAHALVAAASAALATAPAGRHAPGSGSVGGDEPMDVLPSRGSINQPEGSAAPGPSPLPSHVTPLGGLSVDRSMLPRMRVIGQLDRKFILTSVGVGSGSSSGSAGSTRSGGPKQLVIVDQHAVDERIRVEAIEAIVFPPLPPAPPLPPGAPEGMVPLERSFCLSSDGLVLVPLGEADTNDGRSPGAYLSQTTESLPRVLALSAREANTVRHCLPILRAWRFDVELADVRAADQEEGARGPASGPSGEWPSSSWSASASGFGGALVRTASAPVRSAPRIPTACHDTLRVRRLPRLFDIGFTSEDLRDFILALAEGAHMSSDACLRLARSLEGWCTEAGGDSSSADVEVEHWQEAARNDALRRLYYAGCRPPAVTRILNSKACRGAVMFGDELTPQQCNALITRLRACRLPFQCAHGRPSMAPLATLLPAPTE